MSLAVPSPGREGTALMLEAEQLAVRPAERVMAGRSVRERLAGPPPDELEALRAELSGAPPAKAKPKRRWAKASR